MFKMSVLPRSRRLSCHVPDISCHVQTSLLPRSRRRSWFKMSLLPRSRCRSCHVQDVSLAMFQTSLLPRSGCLSCHVQDVGLATFKTSVLPPPRRRNSDEIYVVGKEMSCETMFEGVHCLSFSRQYKVAIASNTPSEFDPNVLVNTTLNFIYH
jgi:hypothetical protein